MAKIDLNQIDPFGNMRIFSEEYMQKMYDQMGIRPEQLGSQKPQQRNGNARTQVDDYEQVKMRQYKRMLLDICYKAFQIGFYANPAESPPEEVFRRSDLHHNIMKDTRSPTQAIRDLLQQTIKLQEK